MMGNRQQGVSPLRKEYSMKIIGIGNDELYQRLDSKQFLWLRSLIFTLKFYGDGVLRGARVHYATRVTRAWSFGARSKFSL